MQVCLSSWAAIGHIWAWTTKPVTSSDRVWQKLYDPVSQNDNMLKSNAASSLDELIT